MTLETQFVPLELENLHRQAAIMKVEGWRFIQTHAVKADEGIDLYYSFMKDGSVINYRVEGVRKDQPVPSITDLFLAAFVFENEARELFGVDMRDIAIDFAGAMYAPAESEPMTFLSPEQMAARDKARKAALAKKAGKSGDGADAGQKEAAGKGFVMTPERQARLDAKMATMSPEKIAKVEAALKAIAERSAAGAQGAGAKADESAQDEPKPQPQGKTETASDGEAVRQSVDATLEASLSAMDADKAARVRAALEGGAKAVENTPQADGGKASSLEDAQVEALLGLMDEKKAQAVRAAIAEKEGE